MAASRGELLLKIAQLKDNIRNKWSALRNNDLETQRQLEIQYKPLIKPLRKLTKNQLYNIKQEVKEEPKEEPQGDDEEGNVQEDEEEVYSSGEDDIHVEGEDESDDAEEHPLPPSEDDETWDNPPTEVDELLAKYLHFIVSDDKSEADFTYGIVYGDGGWRMGRYPVHFIMNDIIIRGKRYKGTPGLFELIFKKHPSNIYTEDDLKTYKAMLMQTRAHIGRDGKVISSRGYKYTNLISNMFPPKRRLVDTVSKTLTPIVTRAKRTLSKDYLANEEKRKKTGEGIMVRLNKNQIDYKHWDDPNELCERLMLLMASKEAGNNGHDGEILSILEELKEAGVIRDFDNVRL